MEEKDLKFIIAISTGMGAASQIVAQKWGGSYAKCIIEYRDNWMAQLKPDKPRKMVSGDIFPPNGSRYATPEDFGIPQ